MYSLASRLQLALGIESNSRKVGTTVHSSSKIIATLTLAFAFAVLTGCDNASPTSASGFDTDVHSGGAFGARSSTHEQFNCTDISEVHVRFSAPGGIDNVDTTLFYSYGGVPNGIHALNVIWDEENHPQLREEVPLDEATVPAAEEGLVDIAGTVEHTYLDIDGDTPRRVRVELTMNGLTGNCSTVRHINLTEATPPPAPAPAPAPNPCGRQTFGVGRCPL